MSNITITLPIEQMNVILAALAEVPFRVSSPVIVEIQKQAQSQLELGPVEEDLDKEE